MNYIRIDKDDLLNGEGIGTVLWVQGCSCKCKGCHNPESWNPKCGLPFTDTEKEKILKSLDNDYISRLTLTGGHPLESYNIETCTKLAKEVKEKFPNIKIWVYTGFLWENVKDLEIMKYIDVLVDGPFMIDLRNIELKWKGSSNQRVINVQESLNSNEIVIYEK